MVGLIDCNAYSHDESPRKKLNEFAVPLFANLSGSIVPATMLEASMFVDVNCVQFAALDDDVLITLERSIFSYEKHYLSYFQIVQMLLYTG